MIEGTGSVRQSYVTLNVFVLAVRDIELCMSVPPIFNNAVILTLTN